MSFVHLKRDFLFQSYHNTWHDIVCISHIFKQPVSHDWFVTGLFEGVSKDKWKICKVFRRPVYFFLQLHWGVGA